MKTNLKTMLFLIGVLFIASVPSALAHTDVTAENARELIDSTDDLTIIDVREPSEYSGTRGHIPGALNYPWNSGVLQARYEELPTDGPVLVVCASGGRSNRAANFLDSNGFSIVYDMLGGMGTWKWETVTGNEPYSKYGGGAGEPNDPYLIYTAEQLNAIGAEPNDWDKHFKLMADIDLGTYTGREFNVIGNDIIPFSGFFDGNRRAIHNFTYIAAGEDNIGLFGYVVANAIKDLGLINPNIDAGTGDYVGALVGHLRDGSISGCYVQDGSVSADKYVGGLVGGTIPTSVLSYFPNLQIRKCYASACVSGTDNIGGLIGFYEGHPHPEVRDNYEISDCYTIGVVSGTEATGGLAGRVNYGTVSNCYSSARVEGNAAFGGLIGTNSEATIKDSFWDIETSGQIDSAGGTGKTTAEMQIATTFLEAGWDFVGETENGAEDIWSICEGTNYPRFVWQIPTGDFVCPDGITMDDFFFLLEFWLDDNCDSSNNYCQGTDLDQSGTVDENDLEIFFEIWLAEK